MADETPSTNPDAPADGGVPAPQQASQRHEDRCPTCRAPEAPIISATPGTASASWTSAKKPAPPGGAVLYVGMNNFKPEVAVVDAHFSGYKMTVTKITVSESDKKFEAADGKSYDLDTPGGCHDFCNGLTTNGEIVEYCERLLKSQEPEDRDDLANVMQVYVQTEYDGVDRMSRVVLSGHSIGTKVYNEDDKGAIYFKALGQLGKVFPVAAGQTRHIMVLACLSGDEGVITGVFKPAFPNMISFSGWTGLCPTGPLAASSLEAWFTLTDKDPRSSLPWPDAGRSNWLDGNYQSDRSMDDAAILLSLHGDDATYQLYWNGGRVDADSHSGWLLQYYVRARNASNRPTITGAEHDYAQKTADQSFRLRFWRGMVYHFWEKNKATLEPAKVQDLSRMTRQQALAAMDAFVASGGSGAAADLLKGLRDLDPALLPETWTERP